MAPGARRPMETWSPASRRTQPSPRRTEVTTDDLRALIHASAVHASPTHVPSRPGQCVHLVSVVESGRCGGRREAGTMWLNPGVSWSRGAAAGCYCKPARGGSGEGTRKAGSAPPGWTYGDDGRSFDGVVPGGRGPAWLSLEAVVATFVFRFSNSHAIHLSFSSRRCCTLLSGFDDRSVTMTDGHACIQEQDDPTVQSTGRFPNEISR